MIDRVITQLKQVPGMTLHMVKNFKGRIFDETLAEINFKDDSGKLKLLVTPERVHHVYIIDKFDNVKFSGYVSCIHSDGLKEEVTLIKELYSYKS